MAAGERLWRRSDAHLPASRQRQTQRHSLAKAHVISHRRWSTYPGNGCGTRLFRYKKKNGTKSNLIKCYVERICEDTAGLLASRAEAAAAGAADADPVGAGGEWQCPGCQGTFARDALIHGRPALKLVGGKVRMAKK